MPLFIARRVLAGVVLVLVVTALTFLLIYAGGGDIATNILGDGATREQAEELTHRLGLDRPIHVQYWGWLTGAVTGDLGQSYFGPEAVSSTLSVRIPVTLSLVLVSMSLTTVLSVVLGVVTAQRRGVLDKVVQVVSVVGFALPSYWIALVLVLLVALPFSVFPATGYVSPETSVHGWLLSITLPSLALVVGGIATVAQQIRGAMIDTLRMDYVRTLRSRGISQLAVVYRHVLRNAAGAGLTVLSLQFIGMLGGAIIVERIFALPGIGSLAASASLRGDIPIVMGVVAFTAVTVVLVNLVFDIIQGFLNPKVRV